MPSRILPFDTETTDSNAATCGLLTISGAIVIDKVIQEFFDFRMRPHEGCSMNDKAFEVTGINKDECLTWPDPLEVLNDHLVPMLGKYVSKFKKDQFFIPMGYNSGFDKDVLWNWFHRLTGYGSGAYVKTYDLDIFAPVKYLWAAEVIPQDIENLQLGTVCKHYGIPIEAHNSLSDIVASITLNNTVNKSLKIEGLDCTKIRRNYEL